MTRKYILLLIGFFAALSLISCSKQQGGGGDEPTGKVTVYGQVKGSDGASLAGVIVSDGTVCAKTDAQGCYELRSALNAKVNKFIFVTTPEKYSAPVVNGIPVFYKKIADLTKQEDGTYRGVDFTLNKISGNTDKFTLFISADPQPRNSNAGYDNFAYHALDCCEDLYRDWRETKSEIIDRPVYGIVLGDIVHENMTLFSKYTNGLKQNGFATYNCPGNHDHDLDTEGSTGGSNMIGLQTFEKNFGPTCYSVDLGKIHLIMMDDMYVPYKDGKCPKGDFNTGFFDNDWTWLKNDLAQVDRSRTIFFGAHGVIYMQPGGTEMGTRTNNHLSDVAHLLAKFAKVHAWFGHSHVPYNHNYASNDKNFPNVESHMVPRSTGDLWTNERLAGGAPRGFVVVDVDGTNVTWKFKPTPYQRSSFAGTHGKPAVPYMDYTFDNGIAKLNSDGTVLDEKYQIVAYPPTAYPEANGYVVANVYWWDDKWSKPTWTADGSTPETMKAFTPSKSDSYDLNDKTIASFYASKESKLQSSDFTWFKNVHTLFYVYVGSASKGSGTVSVTDRFGNKYSTKLTW